MLSKFAKSSALAAAASLQQQQQSGFLEAEELEEGDLEEFNEEKDEGYRVVFMVGERHCFMAAMRCLLFEKDFNYHCCVLHKHQVANQSSVPLFMLHP